MTRLLMSGLVELENSGKIWEGTGLLSTTRKFMNGLEKELKSKTFHEIQYWTKNFLHSIAFF